MHPLTSAFLQGREKFKKNVGDYFDNDKKPRKACHLGAMYWGYFGQSKDIDTSKLKLEYPEIANHYVAIPCEHAAQWDDQGHITSILIHLSDVHDGRSGWTDENVAAWLEKVLTAPIVPQTEIG